MRRLTDENYDVIYLDFSKAFDKVPHQRLLLKLQAHGVEGKVFNWVRAWLSNRKQKLQINGNTSDWGCVRSEVPQGSLLGSLLFIIYINDLDTGVSNDVSKFADDSMIDRVIESHQDASILQDELNRLYDWA